MKKLIIPVLLFMAIYMVSCKKNAVLAVDGTINGVPSISLYGNSNKSADYIFLSTDPAHMEIAYSGNIFTYVYYTSSATHIFLRDSIGPVGAAYLTLNGSKTVFTIDTTYGFTFGSKVYQSE